MLNFSSGTKSQDVQASVESSISKRSGSVYTPMGGKKLVVFIDDLNMPEMDEYGTREALALLHFLIEKGCLYDRGKDLTLKHVCDIDYMAAMRPVGGAIDPRLLSLFCIIHFPRASSGTLEFIVSTVLSYQLEHFVSSAKECITPIVHSTLDLFQAIKRGCLLPHQSFTTYLQFMISAASCMDCAWPMQTLLAMLLTLLPL